MENSNFNPNNPEDRMITPELLLGFIILAGLVLFKFLPRELFYWVVGLPAAYVIWRKFLDTY